MMYCDNVVYIPRPTYRVRNINIYMARFGLSTKNFLTDRCPIHKSEYINTTYDVLTFIQIVTS